MQVFSFDCSFVKAQNDLIKLVKKQEKRHGLNRTDRHDADRGSIGGADDLCDLLQDSMSSQQLQVSLEW